jgi:glutaredoxin
LFESFCERTLVPFALTLYTRPDCHLCERMKAVVREVGAEFPLALEEVDIDRVPALADRFGRDVPVLMVDGVEVARHRVTADALRRILRTRRPGRHAS